MQRMKQTKRVKKTRKIHSKRRKQRGGINNYDIDISSDNRYIFITMKRQPKLIYKIDLIHKRFSKYRLESEDYPLKYRQEKNLFEILYNERLNNPKVRNILSHHNINDLLLREVVFTSPLKFKRPTSPYKKNIKLGRFDKELSPLAEEDYVPTPSSSPTPPPAISVLSLPSSPLQLTPEKTVRLSPVLDTVNISKTSKNHSLMRRRLVEAMQFSHSRKHKNSTPLPVSQIMQGSPYLSLRYRKK